MSWTLEERLVRWRRHLTTGGLVGLLCIASFILGRCSA